MARLRFLILLVVLVGCTDLYEKDLSTFLSYFENRKTPNKWSYAADTIRTWFDSKENKPVVSVKGSNKKGPWADWDSVMQATVYFDSIWYNRNERAIEGYFYENNDFYKLIGRPANKTHRTYWINNAGKVHEVLIRWLPEENIASDQFLKPIVAWATANAPEEIDELYADEEIVPSIENALRWKKLLNKYRLYSDSIKQEQNVD